MITVILRDGSETTLAEWQKIYGLPVGSEQIGIYFSLQDGKIASNLAQYKKLVVNELLIRVLDAFRKKTEVACVLTAFNRSEDKQKELQKKKNADGSKVYAAATNSPHVYFMGADVAAASASETRYKAQVFLQVAKELNIKIRVGWEQYLKLPTPMTFIHIDVCPEYYGVGKPYYDKCPAEPWRYEITW